MSTHNMTFCSKRFLRFLEIKAMIRVLGFNTMPCWARLEVNKIAQKYKELPESFTSVY